MAFGIIACILILISILWDLSWLCSVVSIVGIFFGRPPNLNWPTWSTWLVWSLILCIPICLSIFYGRELGVDIVLGVWRAIAYISGSLGLLLLVILVGIGFALPKFNWPIYVGLLLLQSMFYVPEYVSLFWRGDFFSYSICTMTIYAVISYLLPQSEFKIHATKALKCIVILEIIRMLFYQGFIPVKDILKKVDKTTNTVITDICVVECRDKVELSFLPKCKLKSNSGGDCRTYNNIDFLEMALILLASVYLALKLIQNMYYVIRSLINGKYLPQKMVESSGLEPPAS